MLIAIEPNNAAHRMYLTKPRGLLKPEDFLLNTLIPISHRIQRFNRLPCRHWLQGLLNTLSLLHIIINDIDQRFFKKLVSFKPKFFTTYLKLIICGVENLFIGRNYNLKNNHIPKESDTIITLITN